MVCERRQCALALSALTSQFCLIGARLLAKMLLHAEEHNLDVISGPEVIFTISDRQRLSDIAFVFAARLSPEYVQSEFGQSPPT